MNRSLRRRLLGILSAVILTAWLATAVFSYLDARQKIDEVLDAHLAQSAALLLALLAKAGPHQPVADPVADVGDVAFRALDAAGRTILRSPRFPDLPPDAAVGGFADVTLAGTRWRVHGVRDEATGRVVQVAEPYGPRIELARSVVSHLLHPVWIALPLLAVLIWLSVRWGLAPLLSLAQQLKLRDPGKLEALSEGDAPQEARPLIEALNALFARVTAMQERERRFAADAAHELRTPLAAIRTHAEVAHAARTVEERRRALESVLKGTERAAHLVDQLLVLARLEPQGAPPSAMRVMLRDVAARAVAECAPLAAARNVDLGLSDAEAMPAVVHGDADLLAVLARNLVDNAVRYVGEGGRVDVSVLPAATGASLVVADDGPGLPAEERPRVFDRFYRSLGTGQEGSGLGLSIVARIAELHGATIALGPGLCGRGLSVTVGFPAARPV